MQVSKQCSMSAQQGLDRMAQPFTAAAPRCFLNPNIRQQRSRATAVNAFACSSRSFAAAAARQISAAPFRSSSRRARKLVVRANWGAPVEFSTAKIMSNNKIAEQLHKVVVDVGDLAGGYTRGGQFMQIKVSCTCA